MQTENLWENKITKLTFNMYAISLTYYVRKCD